MPSSRRSTPRCRCRGWRSSPGPATRARSGSPRWTRCPSRWTCGRLKKAIARQWGTVPLIDVLKEAVLRSGVPFHDQSIAGRDAVGGQLLERLLLVLYAYGTNAGIRAVAAGEHGHREERAVLRPPPLPDRRPGRAMAIDIANATFAARAGHLGRGLVRGGVGLHPLRGVRPEHLHRVASRYGGRGVLIYWHVERKSMVDPLPGLNCTASEVAAMVEGAMHHGTGMDVEANYTDTHGHLVTWTPCLAFRGGGGVGAIKRDGSGGLCAGAAAASERTARPGSSWSMSRRPGRRRVGFLRFPAARGCSPNTVVAYAYDLRHLWCFFSAHGLDWRGSGRRTRSSCSRRCGRRRAAGRPSGSG